jgi:hypothetical protein
MYTQLYNTTEVKPLKFLKIEYLCTNWQEAMQMSPATTARVATKRLHVQLHAGNSSQYSLQDRLVSVGQTMLDTVQKFTMGYTHTQVLDQI